MVGHCLFTVYAHGHHQTIVEPAELERIRPGETNRVALEMVLLMNAHAQCGHNSQIEKIEENSSHDSVIAFMGRKE